MELILTNNEIEKHNLGGVSANQVGYAYHLTSHRIYDKKWEIISQNQL